MFDRADDAPAQRAAVVRPGGQREDLESLAIVRFQHLHQQLAGGMGVEVGRQVAQAQPAGMFARGLARQRTQLGGDVQRVVLRHLQLLGRVADQHRVRKRRRFCGLLRRQRAQGRAQPFQFGPGFGPTTGLALQEHQQPACRQLAATHAQGHRSAHAFGGLGLHAQLLERGAQMKVQERVVDLQRQRLQEQRHRLGMARGVLQRHRHRHQVGVVRRDATRQLAQAVQCLVGPTQRQQRMRFERVAQALQRVLLAQVPRTPRRLVGAAALDQRVRGGQPVGGIAVQIGGLRKGRRRRRPALAPHVVLAGLPVPIGLGLASRGGCRAFGCR